MVTQDPEAEAQEPLPKMLRPPEPRLGLGTGCTPSLQPWLFLEAVFSSKAAAIEMQIQPRERKHKALQAQAGLLEPNQHQGAHCS